MRLDRQQQVLLALPLDRFDQVSGRRVNGRYLQLRCRLLLLFLLYGQLVLPLDVSLDLLGQLLFQLLQAEKFVLVGYNCVFIFLELCYVATPDS